MNLGYLADAVRFAPSENLTVGLSDENSRLAPLLARNHRRDYRIPKQLSFDAVLILR